MKTINTIKEQYEGNDFGVEIIRSKVSSKQIKIGSWWGNCDIYQQLCSELRREGYQLLQSTLNP